MTDSTIEHLYKFREELQRARELIQEELKYLRDKSIKHGFSIQQLEKELIETKREIEQLKRLVDKLIRQKEKIQNKDSNSSESLLKTIVKNPVVIIAFIALALIVMVIELQNKDTGGIVKPIIENYGKK